MRFDWKDAAILVCIFVLFNALAGYVMGEMNPMAWPAETRLIVLFAYAMFGWIPVAIRGSYI